MPKHRAPMVGADHVQQNASAPANWVLSLTGT